MNYMLPLLLNQTNNDTARNIILFQSIDPSLLEKIYINEIMHTSCHLISITNTNSFQGGAW